jgi:hypothetical protein
VNGHEPPRIGNRSDAPELPGQVIETVSTGMKVPGPAANAPRALKDALERERI